MAQSKIIKNDINIYPAIFFPLLSCGAAMLLPSACAIIPAFLMGSCQLYCPEPKAITILSKLTAIVIIDAKLICQVPLCEPFLFSALCYELSGFILVKHFAAPFVL